MEQKIKQLEQRRLRIGKAISNTSDKIKKLEHFVQTLAGATLVNPFILPGRIAQAPAGSEPDSLVVKKDHLTSKSNAGTYVYLRMANISGELKEIKLREASVDIRLRIEPFLEQYAEYLIIELEKKFNIQTETASICHIPNIDDHVCGDKSECRYNTPDGPDDYINECECYDLPY